MESLRAGAAREAMGVTSAIITVATMKGGSGKSTIASRLAVHWHLGGRHPTLIDADPQRSIMRLAARERALGGVSVVEDATEDASKTARRLARGSGPVIIDTPGFRSKTTLACLAAADFLLVPVKASPFDVDRMLDTLSILRDRAGGRRPIFHCLLTQTTRDSVIARHIRSELADAGLPVLRSEMTNRVVYPESALWGATPSLIDSKGPAAREIAAIAEEVDVVLGIKRAARACAARGSPRPSRERARICARSTRAPARRSHGRDRRGGASRRNDPTMRLPRRDPFPDASRSR